MQLQFRISYENQKLCPHEKNERQGEVEEDQAKTFKTNEATRFATPLIIIDSLNPQLHICLCFYINLIFDRIMNV